MVPTVVPEVALYCPQIPQNTGNIGRLCVGFATKLHLIEPLGFSLDEKHVRRCGLDYWPSLCLQVYRDFDNFYDTNVLQNKRMLVAFSSRARFSLFDTLLPVNSILLFGSETKGLPTKIFSEGTITPVRIPMSGSIRCFNLANSVAMGVAEAFRQNKLMT